MWFGPACGIAAGDARGWFVAGDDFNGGVSEADAEMQRLIDSQIESHKIGATIAEEALRRASDPSPDLPPDLPPDLLPDDMFSQQVRTAVGTRARYEPLFERFTTVTERGGRAGFVHR